MPLSDISKKTLRRFRNFIVPKTDWSRFLLKEKDTWRRYVSSASPTQKVLIATSAGGHEAMTPVEGLLAVALTLRGAQVHFLLCDKFLPACQMQTFPDLVGSDGYSERAARVLCERCFAEGQKRYAPLGLPVHTFSRLVNAAEKQRLHERAQSVPYPDIRSYEEEGIALGEEAYAGALRFFARGDLEEEVLAENILRRYLEAALLMKEVLNRLFDKISYDRVVCHHGIYVPQGVISRVARKRSARVASWNPAYRKRCVIFSHDDTYHHTLMNEPVREWENMEWAPDLENRLGRYLESRTTGREDWISFYEPSSPNGRDWRQALGMDSKKPFALLLTNVAWDARLHYPANAFPDMMSWVLKSIEYFRKRKDMQLVIRVHPAETRGLPRSRQRAEEEIRRRYPSLPANVFLVGAESTLTSYELARDCDAALIYGTKMGVELAARGIPVIAAGEAWIRGKGVSFDAASQEEYEALLDRLPFNRRFENSVHERAKKYAFHFFFRRMIPLRNLAERKDLWPPMRARVGSLRELLPGQDPGLDVICEGILTGSPFVYPAERILEASHADRH